MCAKSRLKECCHQGLPTIARVVLTRRPYIMVRAPPDLRPAVNRFSIHEIAPGDHAVPRLRGRPRRLAGAPPSSIQAWIFSADQTSL